MRELDYIRKSALRRGISRLCHFTPSRNLAHIVSGRQGILASECLSEDEVSVFNPTDRTRLDGYTGHVCCSIQYPNAWYFRKARVDEQLFRDWVVVLIDRRYLWEPGTKFCPRNAAARGGRIVQQGLAAFDGLFSSVVEGVRPFRRGSAHPDFLPTDEQAEVLIPTCVSIDDLIGVVLKDEVQAENEISRLRLQGLPIPRMLIVPEFFNPQVLSSMLRSGRIPAEREYGRGGTK